MVNAFDQVSPPTPVPAGSGPVWSHSERVWGYAGFWWRVLAWLIDSLILTAATLLLDTLIGGSLFSAIGVPPSSNGHLFNIGYVLADTVQMTQVWHSPLLIWSNLVGLLLPLAYYALLESSRWQATVGKRVCGLRVTRLDGQRISLPRAIGRYFAKFLSALILCIGFLMIGWTRRKQGLHDLIAETLVVRLRSPSDLVRFTPPS
jgi:uncharacterized RDD family membrane protein YckC